MNTAGQLNHANCLPTPLLPTSFRPIDVPDVSSHIQVRSLTIYDLYNVRLIPETPVSYFPANRGP